MTAALFHAYREERSKLEIPNFRLETFPHLTRHTPQSGSARGVVAFALLDKDTEAEAIEEQIAYFQTTRTDFEWKVYSLDSPPDLKSKLLARGFVAEDEEAFMLFDLSTLPDAADRKTLPVEIRKIDDEAGIRDFVRVQTEVWNKNLDWVGDQLIAEIQNSPERVSIYCAYDGNQPIATGLTEYPKDSQFPELHGGAVLPPWREQGIYAEIYNIRIRETRQRGYRYVAVDASPMSRPILEKLGFSHVCTTTPLIWSHG
jgi:hypothetical protein